MVRRVGAFQRHAGVGELEGEGKFLLRLRARAFDDLFDAEAAGVALVGDGGGNAVRALLAGDGARRRGDDRHFVAIGGVVRLADGVGRAHRRPLKTTLSSEASSKVCVAVTLPLFAPCVHVPVRVTPVGAVKFTVIA